MEPNIYQPKVSVIIANYNNAKFIKQAIDSVFEQEYSNIEVIVIDDGSTDQSLDILASYGSRIIFRQQKNKGAASARNHGIKLSTGNYIAFLDSDDVWLKGKINSQIDFLEKNKEYIACYCSWRAWNGLSIPEQSDPITYQIEDDMTGWLYIKLLKASIISTITIVIRRHIVEEVGFFDEKLISGEDHDYWIRMSRLGKIAKLKNLFALYRNNPSSITNKVHAVNYSLLVLQNNVEKYGLSNPDGEKLHIKDYNLFVAERCFVYGYHSFWSGDKDKAVSAFKKSIKVNKYSVKSFLYLVVCGIPPLYKRILKRRNVVNSSIER